MTDREKLIELIRDGQGCPDYGNPFESERCKSCKYVADIDCDITRLADYLLSNGVTVPQWHNAETDPPKEPNEYIVMIKGGASATALLYDEEEWFEMQGDERIGYHVTHWMELPEPPKKEDE